MKGGGQPLKEKHRDAGLEPLGPERNRAPGPERKRDGGL